MKKKTTATILIATLVIGILSGCGNSSQENIATTQPEIASVETDTETIAQETEDAANAEAEAAAKAEEEAAKAAEEEAARQEEANTYYETGRAILYGLDGQEIVLSAAFTNFERALELGKTDANFYLGALYDWYYGYPENNFEKAIEYYEADSDNPYAQLSLGFLYYFGQGVEEDAAKAQELFDTVIAAGYMEGYFALGYIAYGNGDYDTAFECYNKALEGDEPLFIALAMYYLGNMYYNGEGVEQDYAKSLEWFEKAAELGDSVSMENAYLIYRDGRGVEQDLAKAQEWYDKYTKVWQ